jgi:hypothetical protein
MVFKLINRYDFGSHGILRIQRDGFDPRPRAFPLGSLRGTDFDRGFPGGSRTA